MNGIRRGALLLAITACMHGIAFAAGGHYLYDDRGKRDPFVPLIGVDEKTVETLEDVMNVEDIRLQGIAKDAAGRKMAIMNNEMVREGQTVGRVTLLAIDKTTVSVVMFDVEYEVELQETE
jgi:hypothetical protein